MSTCLCFSSGHCKLVYTSNELCWSIAFLWLHEFLSGNLLVHFKFVLQLYAFKLGTRSPGCSALPLEAVRVFKISQCWVWNSVTRCYEYNLCKDLHYIFPLYYHLSIYIYISFFNMYFGMLQFHQMCSPTIKILYLFALVSYRHAGHLQLQNGVRKREASSVQMAQARVSDVAEENHALQWAKRLYTYIF